MPSYESIKFWGNNKKLEKVLKKMKKINEEFELFVKKNIKKIKKK